MLYTKYKTSGFCSFRGEDFWKLPFVNLFFVPWPTYAINQNHLNNFGRRPPRDQSCEVWFNYHKRSREDAVWTFPYIIQCKIVTPGAGLILTPGYQRRRCLGKKHFVLRWAKRQINFGSNFCLVVSYFLTFHFWTNYWCFTHKTLRLSPLVHGILYG